MAKTKLYHLGDILSITGERLVSPRQMEGVHDILTFMTQDSIFTHQLPRVAEECKPWLLRQHPQLAEIDDDEINEYNFHSWLEDKVERYGEMLPVEPIPMDDHDKIDPVEELVQMLERSNPDAKIVVINDEDNSDEDEEEID